MFTPNLSSAVVPNFQFGTLSGFPPRMSNTNLVSNMKPPTIPANISNLMHMMSLNAAIKLPVPSGVFSAMNAKMPGIQSSLSSLTSGLVGQINNALTGASPPGFSVPNPMQTLTSLQSMSSTLAKSGISELESQINELTNNMPTAASVMSASNSISSSFGGATVNIASTFAPITDSYTGGGLASAIDSLSSAVDSISSSVGESLADFSPNIDSLTSAFTDALSGVNDMINSVVDNVTSSLDVFGKLNAATSLSSLNVPSDAPDFHALMNVCTTSELKDNLIIYK